MREHPVWSSRYGIYDTRTSHVGISDLRSHRADAHPSVGSLRRQLLPWHQEQFHGTHGWFNTHRTAHSGLARASIETLTARSPSTRCGAARLHLSLSASRFQPPETKGYVRLLMEMCGMIPLGGGLPFEMHI